MKIIFKTDKVIRMKTKYAHSGVIVIALLFANLFLMNAACSQVTKTWQPTNGGNWLTAGNWSPAGVPGQLIMY